MELSRTKSIIPTSLALYEQCPARFLYAREQFHGKLASASVSSIKGNLLHGLIESFSTSGQMPANGTVDLILEQQQDQYKWLADIAQWPESWTLRKLVGVIERGNLLLTARQKIKLYQSHIQVQGLSNRPAGLGSGTASEANPYGIELEYRHEELELKGRADLTYGEGPVATVIDFKSGQTRCKEGKLKREYHLQLGAYGLMLQQFSTAKTILLKAEGADTTSKEAAFAFDQDHRATIINLCRDIISTFPREKPVQLGPLEKLGDHCRFCPGKGVCCQRRLNFDPLCFVNAKVNLTHPGNSFGFLLLVSCCQTHRVWHGASHLFSFQSVTLTVDLYDVAMMKQAVQQCCGQSGVIGKCTGPL